MNSIPFFAKFTQRIFWVVIAILVLVLAGSGFFIYEYLQSRGLSIEIQSPAEINIGVPFDLTVDFNNQSKSILQNSQLSLNLPDGAVALGASADQRVLIQDLGDIGVGSLSQQTFHLLITKDPNTVKQFTANISYGASGIGQARFQQHQTFDLRINDPGVSLAITPPGQILSGEKFDIKINYHNISQKTFSGLKLLLDYPASFSFQSADIKPTTDNNSWNIPDLTPDSQGNITITGQLIGPSNSSFTFGARLQNNILGQVYQINQNSAALMISQSPLNLSVSLNNQDNYIAKLGDQLVYTISYQNNSGVGLSNAVIKAKLDGDMFDFSALKTNANFDSITDTLTWNASNMNDLKVVAAGDSGSATFELKVKSGYPIRRLGDKNYSLKVSAQMRSPTVPDNLTAAETTGLANLENKVAGAIVVQTKAYFRDAASGIANKGPWPPKVNQATQYTIHWLITNYAADVQNVEVRAFLESGVTWTGQVKGNAGSLPTYNAQTQEVVWNIDKIAATKGITTSPLEVVFQVSATPNSNQAGNYQPLIKQTSITATDTFTQTNLTNSAAAVSTALPDDPTVQSAQGGSSSQGQGIVVQ